MPMCIPPALRAPELFGSPPLTRYQRGRPQAALDAAIRRLPNPFTPAESFLFLCRAEKGAALDASDLRNRELVARVVRVLKRRPSSRAPKSAYRPSETWPDSHRRADRTG